jgi:hypothetical protein
MKLSVRGGKTSDNVACQEFVCSGTFEIEPKGAIAGKRTSVRLARGQRLIRFRRATFELIRVE